MDQMKYHEDNKELFKEYQSNKSIRLRNEIALKNKNLIYKGIRGLYSPNSNDIEELEQEAFICLLKAVETFDPSKGFKFSTYALSCIRAITRNRLDYNIDLSLDEPFKNQDGDDLSMQDMIEDDSIDIEKDCINKNIRNNLKVILTSDEYELLKLHYVKEKNFNDIALILGCSRERVYRIRDRAKKKIYNSKYFQNYREEALLDDEITYLRAYDYSSPKVSTSNISSPTFDAVLRRENRERNIMKQALLGI